MTDFHHSTAPCRHVLPPHRLRSDSAQGTMNMNPKTTRTILAILAAAVAAIVAFNVLTREYGDPARNLIERKSVTKP
jgi:hypothetical protein